MKTYNAVFNPEQVDGVFGISLVKNPAMEGNFVALSEQEKKQVIQFKEVDKEQRILIGLVLEPNKPIYRFNEKTKEEFNIVFNEDTIKNLSYSFFKNGFQTNSTIEHDSKINGVTFVESWIVQDSAKDKSAIYGFSYPVGSWVATMKVDDDKIWNDYVKTGEVLGFSIDAMLDLQEINLKSSVNMSKVESSFLESLTTLLGLNKTDEVKEVPIEVKLGEVKTSDGELTIMYDGEELTAGADMFVMQEDERVAIPEGEYITEMGILVVDAESKLVEVKPMEEEEVVEDAPAEMGTDAPSQTSESKQEALENAIKSILVKYSENVNEKLASFETKLSEVVKENETLKAEVLEFSKAPSAKPIKSAPTQTVGKTAKSRILNSLNK